MLTAEISLLLLSLSNRLGGKFYLIETDGKGKQVYIESIIKDKFSGSQSRKTAADDDDDHATK